MLDGLVQQWAQRSLVGLKGHYWMYTTVSIVVGCHLLMEM